MRNSKIGCLLALLFFIPIFVKAIYLNVNVVIFFTAVIVPIQTLSKTDIIRKLSTFIFDDQEWSYHMTQLSYIFSWVHYIYFQVNGVQTFFMHVIFNTAAEKLFCPLQRFSSLYVLLFYSILSYIKNDLQERPWTQVLNETSTIKIIKWTILFAIRLGKGVAIILILLNIGYQFNHLQPTYDFIIITFLYFCITKSQNNFFIKNTLVDWLSKMELHCLDNLEEHWVPVLWYSLTMGLPIVVLIGLIVYTNNYIIMVILGYINLVIPFECSLRPAWKMLCEQRAVYSYSLPTLNNYQIRGGHPCMVCLDKMTIFSARVTPCNHVFHGSCLRKCIQLSNQCPLCRAKFS